MHIRNIFTRNTSSQRGSILVTILMITMFFAVLVLGLILLTQANLVRARGRIMLLQAQYSAESGADAAIATLNAGDIGYAGSATEVTVMNGSQYRSTFTTAVTAGSHPKERIITATGYVYSPKSATQPTYTRKIRITAQRSTTTTASAMVSRNIIETDSGVKNIVAKDVYVNGFVRMNKNTTNLIVENLTVGGKNTSAGNCSIGGTGNLLKPATFSNPGQTKTKLLLAYNNCITPPGNVSNGNFDVSVNQSTIGTVQSIYIPWNYAMDASYTAGSCADWTNGTSPRTIPAVNGSKQTHYPDSSNNVASTCGTNGDLSLGTDTYTITDHVHLRASLCAAAACSPTFNNPTTDMKYVFIEGSVNFDSVKTSASSGPLTFITYGADPASKTAVCPYGGSIYIGAGAIGSDGTYAPDLYMLAMNGICLDKTKFGTSTASSTLPDGSPRPSLGGIGGKNIYVATNAGSPWDLALDPAFPTNLIPLDLSWRQTGYERL